MGALSSSAISHEVVVILSSLPTLNPPVSLLVRRLPRGQRKSVLSSSAVLPREVKMFAIATAALLVFSVTAQAATKYNYGGRGYKYDGGYKAYKRHDPSYENHYAEDYHREPHYDGYGGDAYSEDPSYTYESMKYRPTHKQSHYLRYRRSIQDFREGQACMRVCRTTDEENCTIECQPEEFPTCAGLCTDIGPNGPQPACRDRSSAAGNRHFCYVSELCKGVRRSDDSDNFYWSADACCGNAPCPVSADPAPVDGM